MADRFPLIVNAVSQKIEELVSGDNLELSGNNIVISGDTGAGKYLSSDGTSVLWGTPGDVYLNQNQTLTNKTFTSCIISGSSNTLSNIPNSALSNSTITVNGSAIALGGSVVTPNDNTTYAISMVDGINSSTKTLRLTAGGSGTGTDDVNIAVGPPASVPAGSNALVLGIERTTDTITISGTVPDADTITTLQSSVGGVAQTGAITIAATGSSTVSQDAASKTITIDSSYVDTITKLRATTGSVLNPGNFTFLDGGATTVTQGVDGNGDSTITYSSVDTITRVKGGGAGSFVTGDVEFTGGTNVTVSQAGNIVTIASVDTDTVTRLAASGNAVTSGDFVFAGAGATSVSSNTAGGVTTITFTSQNDDTGASLAASGGLILQGVNFRIKNYNNFSGNTLMKWDSGNSQLTDSLITDNGSTVTITGDLVVDGTQTVLNTTTLQVEDNSIELRKGQNLTGSNGGIQLNRTTDNTGGVTAYQALQWYESGGYWRAWDGSVEKRFVTEAETQILTNKTLTSPILTAPNIGAAVATSVNGLEIVSTASASIDVASTKTLDVDESVLLTSDNSNASVTVNFRQGGNVAYTSDTLATFASTTSTQMRGLITDTTGLDKMVFQTNPTLLTGITTTSTGFNLINSGATSILFGGAAGSIVMGAATGTTTINHDLVVTKDLTVGATIADSITMNGILNSENSDIIIRGTSGDPMSVGRGGGAVNTNTRVGVQALQANTSGSQNTAYGYQCLFTNNSGASNTALGHRVLRACGVGNNNIGVGKDALLVTLSGSKNVAIGNNAMETNQTGNANVCIGHYAGFDVLGDGNVLIGPADNENSADVTFRPPNVTGDRQLVIGSGGQAWIRGDSNFDITLNNDLTVDGDTLVKGNLTVNGVTTTVKSNIVQITDKNIELAAVVSTQFSATTVSGSADITNIAPTLGLIPGMEVVSNTAGITVPGGTTIVTITGQNATLSNNVTGSGAVTFSAIGPSDTAAEDGGLIVKGTSDKTFLWRGTDGGVTYNYWNSSEHINTAAGKNYYVNSILFASDTSKVIGPTDGGGQGQVNLGGGDLPYTLGSAVTGSSLTSVGTLGSLAVGGGTQLNSTTHITAGGSSNNATSGLGLLNIRPSSSRDAFLKFRDAAEFDNTITNGGMAFDCRSADNSAGRHLIFRGEEFRFWTNGGDTLRIKSDEIIPITTNTMDLGDPSFRFRRVYAESFRFNDNGFIAYNTTANTMEFEVNGGQVAEFTSGSFVPVSSAGNIALGTTAKRWGAIRGQSLDINGTTNTVQIEHTGGAALNLVRNSKSLSFNANYSAADTHAAIEVTSGMDLAFFLGGSEKIRFESNGEARFPAKVRLREDRPFLQLISSAATSNADPRGIINFECENSDNDEDMYRINFWEGTNNGEQGNANASIRYNGSTSDGGDGSIRFVNENSTRLFSVNRLGGGNILGTLSQNSSDIRLKENITPIENALEKVNSLTGFTYTWNQEAQDAGLKGDEHDCVHVGVSAQDVQEVQPEAVKPSPVDREKYLTVQYERLVPLLIEAIKELKEEVEELKRTK